MSDRGYTDPQLWIRLEPALRKVLTEAQENVLEQRVTSYGDYANAMGYIRALRDVFKIAAELQKIEELPASQRHRDILPRDFNTQAEYQKTLTDLRRSKDTWGRMD